MNFVGSLIKVACYLNSATVIVIKEELQHIANA